MARAQYTPDSIIKSGPIVDVRAFGDALTEVPINLAITAIGATSKVMVIPAGAWTISNAITVPTNITLRITGGAVLTNSSTITINGPLDVGEYQVFAGAGNVNIAATSTKNIYAQWFGAIEGADNSTAITNAVAAIATGTGVTLRIPTSLYTETVEINKDDVVIELSGTHHTFDATYTVSGAVDYGIYSVMFAILGSKVNVVNGSFYQGAYADPTVFIWYGLGVVGGTTDNCSFYDIPYNGATLGVAIQTRTSASIINITNCYFENCAGAVSLQSQRSSIDHCKSYVDNTAVTSLAGTIDQPFGMDDTDGSSVTNCVSYKTDDAPISGAHIGCNATSDGCVIANNYVHGVRGGIGLFIQNSTNCVVSNNVIDGGGAAPVGAWVLVRVGVTSYNNIVSNNIFMNPPVTTAFGRGIDISTGNNILSGNNFQMGSDSYTYCCVGLQQATIPGEFLAEGNIFHTSNVGVYIEITDNDMIPVIFRNNTYTGASVTPFLSTSLLQNGPLYVANENFTVEAADTGVFNFNVGLKKFYNPFLNSRARHFPFSFGRSTVHHTNAVPASPAYDGASYMQGDVLWNCDVGTGGSPGWVCITSGTFSAASTTGGITTGTKALVLAAATGFFAGDYITIAGVTGIKRIVTLVGTAATIDSNADATVAAAAVATPAPTFEVMGVLS
jgi:hypothetical protein